MIGIYKITNLVNNKVYIGQSISIERRFKDHVSGLNGGYGHNLHFQNAWNKYGQDNFKFEILEEIENCNLLDEREIYYISLYNSNNPKYGYNKTIGGNTILIDENYRIYISKNKINNKAKRILTYKEVSEIKLAMACLMDRKEIAKMYNVSTKVLTSISINASYKYVLPELSEYIHNLKQKMIDERNKGILKLFDSGKRIIDIINETGYSESIVSKCVHKYRKIENRYYNDTRKEIYNNIMKLYNEGYSIKDICEKLNQPRTTVTRYVDENFDIEDKKYLPFKKVTNEIEKDIINSYFNENKSIKEIYNRLNLSRNTVEFYINRHKYTNTEVS